MVQMMEFVKDEKIVSTLMFTKMRSQNYLREHLDLVVHKFAQPFYTIDTFPYDNVITSWTNEKTRKGVLDLVAHWSKQSLVYMMSIRLSFG